MQSIKLLIAASPNVVDTDLLPPEPEVGSVELFPRLHGVVNGVEIIFYCLKNCLTAENKIPHFKTVNGNQNMK